MSSANQPGGQASGGTPKHLISCNSLLRLGDTCDVCLRGIMLPPGGIAYYEALAKESNPRAPHGHEKMVCTRCGHWHISMGPGFSSGTAEEASVPRTTVAGAETGTHSAGF
jgi:hypothetical protein